MSSATLCPEARMPFVRKLQHGADLKPAQRQALRDAIDRVQLYQAGQDVVRQGEVPHNVHVLLGGWGCRYKLLKDGRRHIMAILLPGDMCDLHVQILNEMDHGIAVLTDAKVAEVSPDRINALTQDPKIDLALNWATLVDEATLREWLVNIGQRPSHQRVAHLICELFVRLRSVGLADEEGFDLLLTQTQLADVVGITSVHVNRTLMTLRGAGLIRIRGRTITISDFDQLAEYAGFEPSYLHLGGTKPDAVV